MGGSQAAVAAPTPQGNARRGDELLFTRFTWARSLAALALAGALVLVLGGRVSHAASASAFASASSTDPIFTIAGTGAGGTAGDGGAAIDARIDHPRNLSLTPDGGYVFAEPFTHTARSVNSGGIITRLAGTGVLGFSGDGGPATAAMLNGVHAASVTADGGFLLADPGNNRIRQNLAERHDHDGGRKRQSGLQRRWWSGGSWGG